MSDRRMLERNKLVALLATIFPSRRHRTEIEGWGDDWHGCITLDTPEGQISFHYRDEQAGLFMHVPLAAVEWDGHDTEEKWRRVDRLIASRPGWALHPQGLHAMGRFIDRLIQDGYIKPSRVAELEERKKHALAGNGFLMQAELPFRDQVSDELEELL